VRRVRFLASRGEAAGYLRRRNLIRREKGGALVRGPAQVGNLWEISSAEGKEGRQRNAALALENFGIKEISLMLGEKKKKNTIRKGAALAVNASGKRNIIFREGEKAGDRSAGKEKSARSSLLRRKGRDCVSSEEGGDHDTGEKRRHPYSLGEKVGEKANSSSRGGGRRGVPSRFGNWMEGGIAGGVLGKGGKKRRNASTPPQM